MIRSDRVAILLLAVGCLAIGGWGLSTSLSAQGDQHSYFNALVRRADHWKSYSFRDPAQVGDRSITYRPEDDTDRHKQDAAKVVIPAFAPKTVLTSAIAATDTVIPLESAPKTIYSSNKVMKIDREIMTIAAWISTTSVSVKRGTFGTAPTPHSAGAVVMRNSNSAANQVRVPLGTQDGHTYLFTWDGYWTDSYLNMTPMNHKAFQFGSGGSSGNEIWLESQTGFHGGGAACFNRATHVFSAAFRSYNTNTNSVENWSLTDGNQVGPGTSRPSLGPRSGEFCARANAWVRWWVRINQRANDYDILDAWVADETTDPVQILKNLRISVRSDGPKPNSIADFWLEFNTSTNDHIRLDERDLVAYVRNFVALRDPGDISNLLIRPVPGAAPAPGPSAPRNVRIVSPSE